LTNFKYKARDRYGVLTTGQLEALDSKIAIMLLEKQGLTPVSLNAIQPSILETKLDQYFSSLQKVSAQELIVFTRQLASVLEAGVPLIDGLDAVSDQIHNHRFQSVVREIKKQIDSGMSFSDAMDHHRDVFSALIVNMIKAGESAGILPQVLDRVSNLLEKDDETTEKLKNATRYPTMVFIVMCGAFVILTVYVIPRFTAFFAAFKGQLPLPTQILIGINTFVQHFWLLALALVAIAVYAFAAVLRTETGRYNWDRLVLSTPVLGALFSKINLSRFSRMLSSMLGAGIPILEALTITSATVDNKVISHVIMDVRNQVAQGKSLAEPMRGSNTFPPIAISMVAIGEKAGTLEKMLDKVADYFDREADYTIRNLVPLLEPLMIFGLGLILLLFALGILLPMWDLSRIYSG
jgi:MSHA biogenesis protein MshG